MYAIAYIRTSTGQSEDNLGSENNIQEQAITDYCEANHVTLCEVFQDYYATGANFERIAWKQMENYLIGVPDFIDFLIVNTYDRISRNRMAVTDTIETLKSKHGVTVLSLEYSNFPQEELAKLLAND
ncbi:recombinase family protein [Pedobacter aquatilis]|uniref:recombinase family protein n=1 Tax=Pedobacter aquatilis TaxID=351343 RepID=UPI00292D7186|nr:recombinase family protein [Pedobacter aquatilis]